MTYFSDLDVFFLSYDEPNAGQNFARLKEHVPQARRIHGVKGFHAAHQHCADLSRTKRFVTVDADNWVSDSLSSFQITEDDSLRDVVYSCKSRNVINGLEYGNGGVKVWPRGLLRVPTHEASADAHSTDFCWTYRYYQVDQVAADVRCNGSPFQAFRSGYREGVKLSLVHGHRLGSWAEAEARFVVSNRTRLLVWASIGRDVENGIWAIYGARKALHDLWIQTSHDVLDIIKDYDLFKEVHAHVAEFDPEQQAVQIGENLRADLDLDLPEFDARQSAFFKRVFVNPARQGLMLPDMNPVEFPDV